MSNNFENFEEELKKGLESQNQESSSTSESSFDSLDFDFETVGAEQEESDEIEDSGEELFAAFREEAMAEENEEETQEVSDFFVSEGEEASLEVESEEIETASDDLFNFGASSESDEVEEGTEEVIEEIVEVASEEIIDEISEEVPADGMFNFGAADSDDSVAKSTENTEENALGFGNFGVVESVTGSDETGVSLAAETSENGMDISAAANDGGSPKPVKRIVRRAKPKKKRSIVGELFKIVLGGLFAFPLAHYIVWGIYLGTGKPAPGGLYPIPTPFIQESYRYVKDFPQIPQEYWKYVLYGFDPARDLAPEPKAEEVVTNESAPAAPIAEGQNPDTSGSEASFGENEEFGGFEMDEDEVAQTAAEYVKFRSGNLPEYDAAEVVLEFDPANTEAFQTAMLKVSFLKDGDDGKKLANVARDEMKNAVKGKKADALNEMVLPWLTKENHGKGIMITGKVEKVVKRGDFKITIVKVDGTEDKVKLISPKTIKNAKGKRYAFTGVIFDPDQDEKVESKKKDEVLIWRGLFKALPKRKAKKAVKDEAAPAEEVKADEAAPVEEAKSDEAAPVEEVKADEAAPAEEVKADEAAPVEEVKSDEAAPAEEVKADEAAPAEEVKSDEAAPVEEAKAEEAVPAEEVKSDEAAPAEEVKADEAAPVEEVKADEAAPAEEVKADEAAPVEEVKSDEAAPVEEAKAEEAAPAEETKADEAAPVEEAKAE